MLALVYGYIDPAAGQTKPAAREALISEVKAYAARHVKAGAPMNTTLVLNLFQANGAGVTPQEIAGAYEDEYARLKVEEERNSWIPRIGWFAAGLLGVTLIFYERVKTWTGKLLDMAGEALFRMLAGTRTFHFWALRRYREALRRKHSEITIPFRPGKPLKLGDVFVPLKVASRPDAPSIDAYAALMEYPRLVVKGAPGAGKSILMRRIALSYADRRMVLLRSSRIPILLELSRLNEAG